MELNTLKKFGLVEQSMKRCSRSANDTDVEEKVVLYGEGYVNVSTKGLLV